MSSMTEAEILADYEYLESQDIKDSIALRINNLVEKKLHWWHIENGF